MSFGQYFEKKLIINLHVWHFNTKKLTKITERLSEKSIPVDKRNMNAMLKTDIAFKYNESCRMADRCWEIIKIFIKKCNWSNLFW